MPDHFTASEEHVLSGNVLTGAGADSGTHLTVTQVDGTAAAVGSPYLLPSGATLVLQADGSFTYDPTTSATLNALPAGASFESEPLRPERGTGRIRPWMQNGLDS